MMTNDLDGGGDDSPSEEARISLGWVALQRFGSLVLDPLLLNIRPPAPSHA